MQKNNISFVISAPSGAGKSTLVNKLMASDRRFDFIISTTTRSKRSSEIEGKSYYFVTYEKFKKMINNNEFIEWAMVYGNYYGTTKKEVDRIKDLGKIPLFDVDTQGAKNIRKKLNNVVYIFIVPPSLEILRTRLINRKANTIEDINLRLKSIKNELDEIVNYDYVVVNDDIDKACDDIKAIIRAEECKDKMIVTKLKDRLEAL
ncbi:MAG: guanylate kinase [Spirochaetota bacterium]|nr:guanylate kinase [Spirochaetota bacterium]